MTGFVFSLIISENVKLTGYNGDCEIVILGTACSNSFNMAPRLDGSCGDVLLTIRRIRNLRLKVSAVMIEEQLLSREGR